MPAEDVPCIEANVHGELQALIEGLHCFEFCIDNVSLVSQPMYAAIIILTFPGLVQSFLRGLNFLSDFLDTLAMSAILVSATILHWFWGRDAPTLTIPERFLENFSFCFNAFRSSIRIHRLGDGQRLLMPCLVESWRPVYLCQLIMRTSYSSTTIASA